MSALTALGAEVEIAGRNGRRTLPVERFGFTLHALDSVDGIFNLLNQAALDGLGELDLPNEARHLNTTAKGLPAGAAEPPLVLARCCRHFLGELDEASVRLPHGVDLQEDHFLTLFDHLVSDFLVAEENELADRAFASTKLITRDQDALGDGRGTGDRLDYGQLATFDTLGNSHLALSGE